MLKEHKKSKKWGCSTNEEDYEINPDFETNLDQAVEMVLDLKMDLGREEDSLSVWIGRAHQYNAAYFVNEALTNWDFFEERAQEMFYDESMCENDEAFKFPQGQDRVEFFAWLEKMCEKMCDKFGIDINYYEIKDPERLDIRIWYVEGEDEPRYETMYHNQRYGSHPLKKSAP